MYTITRQNAAESLNVSTRSIDRYIRSGKIRSEKKWKIVYLNSEDIENLKNWSSSKQEIIIPKKIKNYSQEYKNTESISESIYTDLKETIEKKDQKIEDLSIKLWQAEEIARNSISMIDFKKSQFLLEESNSSLEKELDKLKEEKKEKEKEISEEKKLNIVLISISVVLLSLSIIIWFAKI